MAIHGIHIRKSEDDDAPVFLQVNNVNQAIENTVLNYGAYPYTAWTQYTNSEVLAAFGESDNYASGWEIEGLAGENIGSGQVVYRNSNTTWRLAVADGVTPAKGINMIGFCISGGNTNSPIKILLQGFISISSSNFNHQLAFGDSYNGIPLYLDAANYGYMTDVAPSGSGEIVRTMGYMYTVTFGTSGASGNPVIYFNPDRTFLIV
jgi:hypothetical protein